MTKPVVVGLTAVFLAAGLPRPMIAQSLPVTDHTFEALQWRALGPGNRGGRVNTLAMPASNVMYVGASGGLFKTVNGGANWTALFDREAVSAVNVFAVARSDTSIVWAGTGDPMPQFPATPGAGVYRSLDGGQHWTQPDGLPHTDYVGALAIDPRRADVVYVGIAGPFAHASRERGIYRTRDGGKTWQHVLFVNEWTAIVDLAIDPLDPDVLYAVAWQRAANPVGSIDYGPGSGLYKSNDGGTTWHRIVLPVSGELGRCTIAISPSHPATLYAIIVSLDTVRDTAAAGIYRSDDAGAHWNQQGVFSWHSYVNFASYFGRLVVDPMDADRLYVAAGRLVVSTDGGRTQREPAPDVSCEPTCLGDIHAIWVDPADTRHIVVGFDRGIAFSVDLGDTWTHLKDLPLGQIESIDADRRGAFYHVYASMRDEAVFGGPVRTRHLSGIANADWFDIAPIESALGAGIVAANPGDTNQVYIHWPAVVDIRTGAMRSFGPTDDPGSTAGPAPHGDCTGYNALLSVSPFDPRTLYEASRCVKMSTDGGETWRRISPALVHRVDSARLMGERMRWPSWDSDFRPNSITAVVESPVAQHVLYLGTSDGHVYVSSNGGGSWQKAADPASLLTNVPIRALLASRQGDGTAYVAFNGLQMDDPRPWLFRTTDYGRHWTSLASTLPATAAIWTIVEYPSTPAVLFVGTNVGVFVSTDTGAHWASLRNNMPAVPVRSLVVQPDQHDLIAGTWGRGLWILDDVRPLVTWAESPPTGDTGRLFPVRSAVWYYEHSAGYGPIFAEPNPPVGAIIAYDLSPSRAAAGPEIEILDSESHPLRTLALPPAPGFQRAVWDLRTTPLAACSSSTVQDKHLLWCWSADDPRRALATWGDEPLKTMPPLLPPGRYLARLTVARGPASDSNARVILDTASIAILPDRLDPHTPGQYDSLYTFMTHIKRAVVRGDTLTTTASALLARLDSLRHLYVTTLEHRADASLRRRMADSLGVALRADIRLLTGRDRWDENDFQGLDGVFQNPFEVTITWQDLPLRIWLRRAEDVDKKLSGIEQRLRQVAEDVTRLERNTAALEAIGRITTLGMRIHQ